MSNLHVETSSSQFARYDNRSLSDIGQPEHRPRKVPAVPDLRFEKVYVKTVRQYIRIERSAIQDVQEGEKGKAVSRISEVPQEVVQVNWGGIVLVTLRDQLLSPLIQGILW